MGRRVDSSRAGTRRGAGRVGRGLSRCRPGRYVPGRTTTVRKPSAQKKPGLLTPEQQRQEENGDAAASPATYRKDRQRIFRRVRNFFRSRARFLSPAFHGFLKQSARGRCSPGERFPPISSSTVLIAWRAEPWRADRFPRGGLRHGRLRCCCRRSAGSGPCLVPTGAAARRRAGPGNPSRFRRG